MMMPLAMPKNRKRKRLRRSLHAVVERAHEEVLQAAREVGAVKG